MTSLPRRPFLAGALGAVSLAAISASHGGCKKRPPGIKPKKVTDLLAAFPPRVTPHWLGYRGAELFVVTGGKAHQLWKYDGAKWHDLTTPEVKTLAPLYCEDGKAGEPLWCGGAFRHHGVGQDGKWVITAMDAPKDPPKSAKMYGSANIDGVRHVVMPANDEVYRQEANGQWLRAALPKVTGAVRHTGIWSTDGLGMLLGGVSTSPGKWFAFVHRGGKWAAHPMPADGGRLITVHGSSATNVWIGGYQQRNGREPLLIHYDGSTFTPHDVASGERVLSIFVQNETSALAVGRPSLALHWNGKTWRRLEGVSDVDLLAVTGGKTPNSYIVAGPNRVAQVEL